MNLFVTFLSAKLTVVIPVAGAVFAVLLFWLYRQCRRKQINSLFAIDLALAGIGLLLPLFSRLDAEITPELAVTVLIIITIVLLASSIYVLLYKGASQEMLKETEDQQQKKMIPDEAEMYQAEKNAVEMDAAADNKAAAELAEEAAYFQKAVTAFATAFGGESPDTALSYYKLACVYYQLSDFSKAYDCFIKAASIREKEFGLQHPDTLQVYCWLEKTCWALADDNKALEYRRLREISE